MRTVDVFGSGVVGYDLLTEAVRHDEVVADVSGPVFVLRHAEIDRLLNDRHLDGVGLTYFDLCGVPEGPLRRWYGSIMFTNDGPEHLRLRRLVNRAFTPRSVERLRTHAEALVAGAFESIRADGAGDLVDAFAWVPMRVMCRLLGVPDSDVSEFAGWTDDLSPVFGVMTPDQISAATAALASLTDYVDGLVDRRRADPADDVVTALIQAEEESDQLTHGEVIDMVANLLVAGHDTTFSQIACSLWFLLAHPEAMAAVAAGEGSIGSALSETMRLKPGIGIVPRTVREPISIGGVELPAGAVVALAAVAAGRDPNAYERPDDFQVDRFDRPETAKLLSFGAGPHYCLGASLARMTLESVLAGVCELDLTMTEDPDSIEWGQSLGQSPTELPVVVGCVRFAAPS